MRILIISVFITMQLSVWSQTDKGCIYLDFERFPNELSQSGMVISDQFKEDFGISFRLEDGRLPVLAEVGSPTEAFGSAWGNDTPAPGVDIGRFFLTDDGSLSGLTSPAMILDFETPIDSFGGCILDMDYGELFVIQALDEFGNVILEEEIVDGDPNTGDGELTCWGFNLPGCVGSIYSIKFAGFRETAGAFGLGLDHFSFCYSGLNIDVEREPETCTEKGSIAVTSVGSDVYEFSIDGINYFPTGEFNDVESNFYTVFVRDGDGCETSVDIYLAKDELFVTELNADNTTCGLNNGSVIIDINDDNGAQYSIDGINFQDSNVFNFLPPGDYPIWVIDDNGCEVFESITIDPSTSPEIESISEKDDACRENLGRIEVLATGNGLTYSIDGLSYQDSPIFENLTEGAYEVLVKNILDCEVSIMANLETTENVVLASPEVTPSICNRPDGSILINASGGEGAFLYSIEGSSVQPESMFEDLNAGNYIITITDANGCSAIQEVDVLAPEPIILENVDQENTTCDKDNGRLIITTNLMSGVNYLVNGDTPNTWPVLDSLAEGQYELIAIDENGCQDTVLAVIEPSIAISLDAFITTAEECEKVNGSISVKATGGVGPLSYALDEGEGQSISDFNNLLRGPHQITVEDSIGCRAIRDLVIDSTPVVAVRFTDVTTADCFEDEGVVVLSGISGTGTLSYTLNGLTIAEPKFSALAPGKYEIKIVDSLGCENFHVVEVPIPDCAIYIPNVISLQEFGMDKIFRIFTNERYMADVLDYSIYDRWGELIFNSEGFVIHDSTASNWWNGRFNNKMAEQDVYTYRIEILHPTKETEILTGTVMLLR